MKKRIVSMLLCAAMCMTAAPSAYAMEVDSFTETAAEGSDEGFEDLTAVPSKEAGETGTESETVTGTETETETETTTEITDIGQDELTGADVQESTVQKEPSADASGLDADSQESLFNDGNVFAGEDLSAQESGNTAGSWRWDQASGTFSYYDPSGKQVALPQLDQEYQAQGKYTGYYLIDGNYYCLDEHGVPRTGMIQLTANGVTSTYYFQEEKDAYGIAGRMFYGGWLCRQTDQGEKWQFFNTGRDNVADLGKLYEHGTIVTKLDLAVKGDRSYLLDKNGYILKNAMKKAENGKYYLTDAQGQIYINKIVTYKGSKYYVGKYGSRATWKNCWHRCTGAGNRMYYFGKTPGKIVKKTGWQKVTVNGKFYGWFYFTKNGNHYKNKLLKSGYYFRENGKLASGMYKVGKKTYFFTPSTSSKRNGKMVKGRLATDGTNWYYAYKTGVLRKNGWQKVKGNSYYFKNYKAVRNTFIKKGSTYGYLDNTGRFTTGWVIENDSKNLVRYIDPSKKGFVKNTSCVIDGLRYYFDADGYRINDVTDRVAGPYSVTVDRVNGVMTVYNSNRTIPVKSIRVSVGLPSTPTPVGTFRLSRSARWQPLMGNSWGQYGTHVTGNVLVHSVPGGSPDVYALPAGFYNMLGEPASHGCIRVCVADAKWVYENCNGSAITIFDGTARSEEVFKGPLGRNPLVALRAPYTFDPTDPSITK